jgi:hypothetical protein
MEIGQGMKHAASHIRPVVNGLDTDKETPLPQESANGQCGYDSFRG